jgi:hypothetical protein
MKVVFLWNVFAIVMIICRYKEAIIEDTSTGRSASTEIGPTGHSVNGQSVCSQISKVGYTD